MIYSHGRASRVYYWVIYQIFETSDAFPVRINRKSLLRSIYHTLKSSFRRLAINYQLVWTSLKKQSLPNSQFQIASKWHQDAGKTISIWQGLLYSYRACGFPAYSFCFRHLFVSFAKNAAYKFILDLSVTYIITSPLILLLVMSTFDWHVSLGLAWVLKFQNINKIIWTQIIKWKRNCSGMFTEWNFIRCFQIEFTFSNTEQINGTLSLTAAAI